MTTINTNTSALIAQLAMKRNEREATTAMEQLSTGKRINRAYDDAAGLAVVVKLNSTIKGLDQVIRNANDAVAMSETTDAGLDSLNQILLRMRELAVQAASDTATERDLSNTEFLSLRAEIDRTAQDTELNDIKLLNGDGDRAGGFDFQVGTRRGQIINISVPDFTLNGTMSTVANVSIATREDAGFAIDYIDDALDQVLAARADIGATISRLRLTVDNLTETSLNTQAARSGIMDADYASASTELARTQIIQEATTAMLAQANTTQRQVLKLLE